MNYLTTTQLRTKSSALINMLLAGESVELIHRSKIVGEINPKRSAPKIFNAKRVEKLAKKLNLEPLSYAQREKRYRVYMAKRHGQNISRHK